MDIIKNLVSLLKRDGKIEIKEIENSINYWIEINGIRGEGSSLEEAFLSAMLIIEEFLNRWTIL